MSLAANLTSALLRLYTYPYRKAHASLSRSIRLKSATRAPKGTILSSYPVAGITCKVLTPEKTPLNPPLLFVHGGGVTQPLSRPYIAFAAKLSRLMSAEVFMPDYPPDSSRNACILRVRRFLRREFSIIRAASRALGKSKTTRKGGARFALYRYERKRRFVPTERIPRPYVRTDKKAIF